MGPASDALPTPLFTGGLLPGRPEPVRVPDARDRVAAGLALAVDLGSRLPLPGSGHTLELWDALSRLAAVDLTLARVVEPHLDALAILAQSPRPVDLETIGANSSSTWGVYAAEAPDRRLEARRAADGWRLTGTKAWCSLANRVSHALVTAWTSEHTRRLFAVSMTDPGVTPGDPAGWVSRGLAEIPSMSTEFADQPAVPVGEDGWYLDRPGFAWGGVGVAACWHGGAAGVAARLLPRGRVPDQIALMHLGAAEIALFGARSALLVAADLVDQHPESADASLAARVRGVVRRAAEEVLTGTARATGPAPLALEESHARRVADLSVYLRQEHAARDDAALGARLTDAWG